MRVRPKAALADSLCLGLVGRARRDVSSRYNVVMDMMPIMLRVDGRGVVVVGGGAVARRRANAFAACGAKVRVVAPQVIDEIEPTDSIEVAQREYQPGDLDGAALVVVATDDPAVNQRITEDARQRGVLVNRTDDADDGDFVVPAHGRRGPITLAVTTDGISAKAAAGLRDQLLEAIDSNWLTLLEHAAPLREQLQREVSDAAGRHQAMRRLVDDEALAVLREGGVEALRSYHRQVMIEALGS